MCYVFEKLASRHSLYSCYSLQSPQFQPFLQSPRPLSGHLRGKNDSTATTVPKFLSLYTLKFCPPKWNFVYPPKWNFVYPPKWNYVYPPKWNFVYPPNFFIVTDRKLVGERGIILSRGELFPLEGKIIFTFFPTKRGSQARRNYYQHQGGNHCPKNIIPLAG